MEDKVVAVVIAEGLEARDAADGLLRSWAVACERDGQGGVRDGADWLDWSGLLDVIHVVEVEEAEMGGVGAVGCVDDCFGGQGGGVFGGVGFFV